MVLPGGPNRLFQIKLRFSGQGREEQRVRLGQFLRIPVRAVRIFDNQLQKLQQPGHHRISPDPTKDNECMSTVENLSQRVEYFLEDKGRRHAGSFPMKSDTANQ